MDGTKERLREEEERYKNEPSKRGKEEIKKKVKMKDNRVNGSRNEEEKEEEKGVRKEN